MSTKPKIYLAPIQGMTNHVFLQVYSALFAGVDAYYAPFVKINKDRNVKKKAKNYALPAFNPSLPLVPQILSNDADEFLILDQDLQTLGYPEFNWNLGCPVPMVTLKKRGSGLLGHPQRIMAILEHILPKLHCSLSIKLRLGLDNPDELLALIPIFNQFPIKELIIHPRIGKQLYKGHVNLEKFNECLLLSKHPVVYNGDIFTADIFQTLQKQFPQVKDWMLGRGILANPFLAEQIKGIKINQDKLERLQQFHAEISCQYEQILSGKTHVMDKLKEFWLYLHFCFEAGAPFYHALLKTKHYIDFTDQVQQFFATKPVVSEHLQVVSADFR